MSIKYARRMNLFIAVAMMITAALLFLIIMSCASPLKKACDELNKATDKLNQAILIAKVANEKDPNLVTEKNIDELTYLRDSIMHMAGTACIFSELIPVKKGIMNFP